MSDEIQNYSSARRRKRSWSGSTWTPPTMSAHREDGAWCRVCKKRHGYKTMGMSYYKADDGHWVLLWTCPVTTDVILEQDLKGGE